MCNCIAGDTGGQALTVQGQLLLDQVRGCWDMWLMGRFVYISTFVTLCWCRFMMMKGMRINQQSAEACLVK
jgi:hypothetical protein